MKADFYVLSGEESDSRLLCTCRLAEKAHRQNHSVFVVTQSESQSAVLDRLMWTFRESSFLPHCLAPRPEHDHSSILIGDELSDSAPQILINLGYELPEGFDRAARLCQVVDQGPECLKSSRKLYKQLTSLNIKPETHHIQA